MSNCYPVSTAGWARLLRFLHNDLIFSAAQEEAPTLSRPQRPLPVPPSWAEAEARAGSRRESSCRSVFGLNGREVGVWSCCFPHGSRSQDAMEVSRPGEGAPW